jgi:hypothetical protein
MESDVSPLPPFDYDDASGVAKKARPIDWAGDPQAPGNSAAI